MKVRIYTECMMMKYLLYGKNYNKLINLLYRNEDKGKLSY